MIRISSILVAICMVLVAASTGIVLFAIFGLSSLEAAIVALTTLTLLLLFNAASMRMRERGGVNQQLDELSRGAGDVAEQITEIGRRLSALEGKVVSANSAGLDRVQSALDEIGELGTLVKQLASSVASHDDMLTSGWAATAAIATQPLFKDSPPPPAVVPTPGAPAAPSPALAAERGDDLLMKIKDAIEANRIDVYLQPIVTLPQRKVRFYEAVTRLRDDQDALITAENFIGAAEQAGLMGRIDNAVMLRCMQVLRRLMVRNKDVGVFCNVAAETLRNKDQFEQCLDFLDANRALAASFVLEFKLSTFRNLSPIESEHLAALAQRGYRFSIDNVADLRIEPRELADRGVRYIKVPAALLLDNRQTAASDIDAADLSDLLGRFGIDLIAERIEGERAVIDLLDFDVRFGQGFLFAAPRPLRPEATSATAEQPIRPVSNPDLVPQDFHASPKPVVDPPRIDAPPLTASRTGNAALARRAFGQS